MSALEKKVLVLNASWQPMSILSAFDAICSVYSGRAHIIGSDYRVYDFDEWICDWEDAISMAKLSEEEYVSCINYDLVIPEVIKFKEFKDFKEKLTKLSRGAIYDRDELTCQYCAKKGTKSLFNIDHVIPKCLGGKSKWDNVVLSCIPCNTKKGGRTPEQANMKLLKKPVRPHWSAIQKNKLINSDVPKSWEDFLGKMYWDITLKN